MEIKIKDKVGSTEAEPIMVVEAPEQTKAVMKNLSSLFKNRVPANWIIVTSKLNQITAKNSVSNETFTGTIKEFNKRMRG